MKTFDFRFLDDDPNGWKYRLRLPYEGHNLGSKFANYSIQTEHFEIIDGTLTAYAGYSWDGCSGPTLDSPRSMRASLVHDILYQCISEGHLPAKLRKSADKEFSSILREDGFSGLRRWYYYRAVRWFGGMHIKSPTVVKRRKLKR